MKTEATTELPTICENCDGTGSCPMCYGSGFDDDNQDECICCSSSGDCPECSGSGEQYPDD